MKRLPPILCVVLCLFLGTAWAQNFPPNTGPAVHYTIVTTPTFENLQNAWESIEVLTFGATAQVTLPTATFGGQSLTAFVCQNATGGFTPTFTAGAGLTIVGTFPTFTTAANKCGDFTLIYTSPSQAYVKCSAAGPL